MRPLLIVPYVHKTTATNIVKNRPFELKHYISSSGTASAAAWSLIMPMPKPTEISLKS